MKDDINFLSKDITRTMERLEKIKRRFMDEKLKDYKIKGSMFLFILFLNRNPGASQEELVEFIGIDKSGIARKCKRLEDLGYIYREQSEENRRQYKLYLTSSGRDVLPIIREGLSVWSDDIMIGINESEQKKIKLFLEIMLDNAIEKYN
jgi:DNA-binding MarR family transcriptional regulator